MDGPQRTVECSVRAVFMPRSSIVRKPTISRNLSWVSTITRLAAGSPTHANRSDLPLPTQDKEHYGRSDWITDTGPICLLTAGTCTGSQAPTASRHQTPSLFFFDTLQVARLAVNVLELQSSRMVGSFHRLLLVGAADRIHAGRTKPWRGNRSRSERREAFGRAYPSLVGGVVSRCCTSVTASVHSRPKVYPQSANAK
jgi:hypothetical protein